ncbi:MAG: tetratricopeptide repeat protein [Flavobacteriales bacterium]|nr:tetratricopeptide repeat protein [Flavobacteriales bacterium]
MAVTYVVLLPLTFWFFKSLKLIDIGKLIAYLSGVLLVYFLVRNAVLDTITFGEEMSILNNGLAAAENYSDQLATTFFIFGHYIKLLCFPSSLAWDYSFPTFEIVSFNNLQVLSVVSFLLVAGILSLIYFRTKSIFIYSFLFFIITFSIVSNFFILIGCTLGERFLFFPSIGFCILVVYSLEKLTKQIQANNKNILVVFLLVVSSLYAFKTIDRNKDWANNYSLFISGEVVTPNNSRAVGAVGSMYRELAEQSKSQQEQFKNYKKSIQYYQKSVNLLPSNSDSYYNLGVVYMATQQFLLAEQSFNSAIQSSPNMAGAYNNLGVIYFDKKNYETAKEYFTKCLESDPNFQNAIANLGAVYHNTGQLELARQFYIKALKLNPNDVNSRNNLNNL